MSPRRAKAGAIHLRCRSGNVRANDAPLRAYARKGPSVKHMRDAYLDTASFSERNSCICSVFQLEIDTSSTARPTASWKMIIGGAPLVYVTCSWVKDGAFSVMNSFIAG